MVVFAQVWLFPGYKLFGTSTEEQIRSGPVWPYVVGVSVEEWIHYLTVLASIAGMGCQGGWGRICNECSRNDPDTTAGETLEDFSNALNLGIIKRIFGAVRINAERSYGPNTKQLRCWRYRLWSCPGNASVKGYKCQTAHCLRGNGLGATIVGKGGFVFSWLVQGDLAIRLWGHTNDRGFGLFPGEEIWDGKSKPRNPMLQLENMEAYPRTT